MAEVVRYVDPDVAAGDGSGDSWVNAYSSLNAWEAAEQTDLVTATDTHIVYCRTSIGTADTVAVNISGWTTSETYFLTIESVDEINGVWDTSAYRLETDNASGTLLVSDNYITLIGVQLQNSGSSARRVFDSTVGTEGLVVDRCIARADNAYAIASGFKLAGSGTSYIRNSLVYGYGTNGLAIGILADNGTVYAYNCTVVDISNDGYSSANDATLNVKNCIAFGIVDVEYLATGTINADYCGYEDSDPGTNGINLSSAAGTDLFADYANDDFRIKNTSSGLYDVGTDLSEDATLPIIYDISNRGLRINNSIGCDELLCNQIRYVDTDVVTSTGLGDGTTWLDAYSSINTAEAGLQADLPSERIKMTIYCRASSGTADSTGWVLGGWDTSATYDLTIEAASTDWAEKSGINTAKYRYTGGIMYHSHDYVTFRGLQVTGSDFSWSSSGTGLVVYDSMYLVTCLIRHTGGSVNTDVLVYNTIVYAETGRCVWIGNNNDVTVYNSILSGTGAATAYAGIAGASGTHVIAANVACVNCYDDFLIDGTSAITNCAGVDGDGTNAVAPSGSDWDLEFLDPDGGDFTLLAGGNCFGAGVVDPGSGLFLDDIRGELREEWSVGASDMYVYRYIDPDASGTGSGLSFTDAYSSMNSWEAAEETSLVASQDRHRVLCRKSGSSFDNVNCTIDGWTTDANYFITVEVPEAYRHDGTRGTGYIKSPPGQWDYHFNLYQDYVTVIGVEFDGEGGVSNARNNIQITGDYTTLDSCFIYDSGIIGIRFGSYYEVFVINCMIVNSAGDGIFFEYVADSYVYNTVIINSGNEGIDCNHSAGRDLLIKNSYIGGSVNDDIASNPTYTAITTSYTEDGSISTPTSALSTSTGTMFTNVTPGSEDVRLTSEDSELYNVGSDLSADGSYPFDYDFEGTTRVEWCVGPYEFRVNNWYVDPDAVGAGTGVDFTNAYTSLNVCEAAKQEDMVANGTDRVNIYCRSSAGTADTVATTFVGWTTDSTHFITIEVPLEYRHDGTRGTGYLISVSVAYGGAFDTDENYVVVDGIACTNSYGSLQADGVRVDGTNCTFKNMLIYDCYRWGMWTTTNQKIINCIIYGCGYGLRVINHTWIYNTVILNSTDYGVYVTSWDDATMKNCYIGGSGTTDYYKEVNGDIFPTTCFSSDGSESIPVSAMSISAGAYFTNVTPGSEDCKITSVSSGLYNTGTDLSADGVFPFDYDFEGTTRVGWCIGPYEFIISQIIGDILSCIITSSGWAADITIFNTSTGGTYDFGLGADNDPSTAKIKFSLTSEGYDNTGSLGTLSRTIYGVPDINEGAIRKVYPNDTDPNEFMDGNNIIIKVALSEFIYDDDSAITVDIDSGWYTKDGTPSNTATELEVTNESIEDYPVICGGWGNANAQVVNNNFDVEYIGFHKYGTAGKPLACVKITATDESANSVTETLTDMVVSSESGDQQAVLVYKSTIDVSSLTDGDKVTIEAQAYPWVGDADSIMNTNDGVNTFPTPLYTNLVFRLDKALDHGWTVVDTGGNDGTGTVYGSQSAAEAGNAFLTIAAALTAVQAYNNTNAGHNDAGGGTLLLGAGTFSLDSTNGGTLTEWVTIKPKTGVTKAQAIFVSGGNFSETPARLKIDGVTYADTGFFNGDDNTCLWVNDSDLATTGLLTIYGSPYIAITYSSGFLSNELGQFSTYVTNWALIRGNDFDDKHEGHTFVSVGNTNVFLVGITDVAHTLNDNGIFAFNVNKTHTSQNRQISIGGSAINQYTHGIAIVQNIFERTGSQANQLIYIAGDGSIGTVNNVILWYNVGAGARWNVAYNDSGTGPSYRLNWSIEGNIISNYNIKADPFSENANDIGGWSVRYAVGSKGNHYRTTAGWIGDFQGLYMVSGTSETPLEPDFVSDRSADGTDAGDGDYHLNVTSSALALFNDYLLPFDLEGNARSSRIGDLGAYIFIITESGSGIVRLASIYYKTLLQGDQL